MIHHTVFQDDAGLMEFARVSAGGLTVSGRTKMASVRKRLTRALRRIKHARNLVSSNVTGESRIPPECEWLLDNWYLVEREGLSALDEIKNTGRFPRGEKRYPAVLSLAQALVSTGEENLKAAKVLTFLKGAQQVRALEEGELWAFVPMLKAAVVLELESVCQALLSYNAQKKQTEDQKGDNDKRREIESLFKSGFTSLRLLSAGDLAESMAEASILETTLAEDPSGIYPEMDEGSRAYYRHMMTRLARKNDMSETEAARLVIELCRQGESLRERHVGFYILEQPLGKKKAKWPGRLYFLSIALLTAALTAITAVLSGGAYLPLILALPYLELAKNLSDYLAIHLSRPKILPKLELADGLPEEGRTLCVISTLLGSKDSGAHFAELLERYMLANRDSGDRVSYGILADFPDSGRAVNDGEHETAEACAKEIEKLNKRYDGGFYLFLRDRELNKKDKRFMGYERKRGAILNLCAYLRGEDCGSLRLVTGKEEGLKNTAFLLTLDADTRLCAGSVRRIIGAMLHPLNRPVIDEKKRIVTRGHAILQPRISVDLASAGKSVFSRVFAGQGGIDPYSSSVSDVYHDLFGEGIFTGKGAMDIDAVNACLAGRFPRNTVLSHDLLEGSYLRAGLVGDVELTDGHPSGVVAYYKRLHRWIRGDWQAARWLGNRVGLEDGRVEKNPISCLSKWKLFDNIRRAVTHINTLTAIVFCLFLPEPVFIAGAVAAVACSLSGFLISGGELIFRSRLGRGVKYHSTIVAGVKGVLLRSGMQLTFLPHIAAISLSATVTALWRMFVSGKNLLEWVTAGETEKKFAGHAKVVYSMRFQMIIAVAVLGLTRNPVGWFVGSVWLLGPFLAAYVSAERETPKKLSGRDRAFLLRETALMWGYFNDFLNEENNYLPPDNWQQQPAVGVAARTSPTNIGLALLCAVSAKDLGFISESELTELLDRVMTGIERLTKWKGHVLNWYDTRTLKPLYPRCVSTVDSGNLLGCLIALERAMYEIDTPEARAIAARAERIAAAMNFEPLYDKKLRLFYISYDLETGKSTEGHYDLMASEARQTSYIAVARGEVERRHWSQLSRALASCDGYRGMVSWTGTMFEYLMPHLLLPLYEDSLAYESARFALYCQKKHGAQRGIPWGVSESAFYSFDPALNYQYKAHGVQRLGLKRGLDRENVISPYSTFLALLVEPSQAVKNLRKLREYGLEGRYGFYEAADFTPSRLQEGKKYEIVRCFMAHHIGMSIIAANNALNENIMQSRFMKDPRMAAFSELLQEKVPVGASVIRPLTREVPEKPDRADSEGYELALSGYDALDPRLHTITNGSYKLLLTDMGQSRASCFGIDLTRFSGVFGAQYGEEGGGSGQLYFLRVLNDDGCDYIGFTPSPFYREDTENGVVFSGKGAKYTAKKKDIELSMYVGVPSDDNGELRELSITNKSKKPLSCELVVYFEPVLAQRDDYRAHMAFSKLFLETSVLDNSLIIRRKTRGEGKDLFMAFSCDADSFQYDTSREKALGRGGFSSITAALDKPAGKTSGAVVDPCVLIRVPVTVAGEDTRKIRFSMAVAGTTEDAADTARRILKYTPSRGVGPLDGHARLLGLTRSEIIKAYTMLSRLLFPRKKTPADPSVLSRGQSGLWKYGISGDLPIALFFAGDGTEKEAVAKIIRRCRFLWLSGAEFDLLCLTKEGSDYMRPARGAITEVLKAINAEGVLGAAGGVHIIDESGLSDSDVAFLRAAVTLIVGEDDGEYGSKTEKERPLSPVKPCLTTRDGTRFEYGYNEDGSFSFTCEGRLPVSAWSHVLANVSYGYVATDAGTGHMWRANSRENKMTPWTNDPLATAGGERIEIEAGGVVFSPFADNDGLLTRVTYGFGYARWEKKVGSVVSALTGFVPKTGMARVFMLELMDEKGGPVKGAKVRYSCDVVMGTGLSERSHVTIDYDEKDGLFTAKNPYDSEFLPQSFHFYSHPSAKRIGKGSGIKPRFEVGLEPEESKNAAVAVLVSGCSQNEAGVELLKRLAVPDEAHKALSETLSWWERRLSRIKISTPNEALNRYMNGWVFYQNQACRLFARTSLFQCGGAYGFRDQLQDVGALLYTDPDMARSHILRASAHQYEEGDVQHWWHPHAAIREVGHKGVRTKCSDDLLWLPYTLCEYLETTGDVEILDIKTPYLSSPTLSDNEHERYELPAVTKRRESVFEHAMRAIDMCLARGMGEHGLPLIGTGDWNDGFNLVGAEGRGESVWLGWFLAHTLERFAELCRRLDKVEIAEGYEKEAKRLIAACEASWDGRWYLRGFYDDGSTLGSHKDEECRIDSIAQSFSTLCEVTDAGRRETAVNSALEHLRDREHRLVRLFAPSFEKSQKNPGYIKGYLPGVRENGGQYTHAAAWLAMGCFRLGKNDDGLEILDMLLPSTHDHESYRTEPYVVPADVYYNKEHAGRGGWSWYTGAAGWFSRVVLDNLCGVSLRWGELRVEPHLPSSWNGFSLQLKVRDKTLNITVRRGEKAELTLNGERVESGCISLEACGENNEILCTVKD